VSKLPRVLRALWKVVTAGRLLAGGLILLVAIALALWVIPSNDIILLPDRAHPVAPLISIAGGHNPNDGGGVYFVDVQERKASLLEQMFPSLHDGASLYPSSEILGPGVTSAQQASIDAAEMKTSQNVAAAVALRALGRKVTTVENGALISGIESGFPAAGRLQPTDVIVAIDGKRVRAPADVSKVMDGKPPGTLVSFTVRRGHDTKTIALHTVPDSPGSHRGIVGVLLTQAVDIRLPLRVSIDANGVGGPSAGLAFALGVLEKLGRNVDGGHKIAATGEISLNGNVGAIGGIKQKTIGAREAGVDAFLVPAGENARDARKYAHGLRIIPVKSFQQALHALATLPAAG
jgi:PDZ domain-containing protein